MEMPRLVLEVYLTPIGDLNRAEMSVYLSLNHQKFVWRSLDAIKAEAASNGISEDAVVVALERLHERKEIRKYVKSDGDVYALYLRLPFHMRDNEEFSVTGDGNTPLSLSFDEDGVESEDDVDESDDDGFNNDYDE